MRTARYCLMDALGCGLLALSYPACAKLLGPVVPGAAMTKGARIPGTHYELDPVQAAFNTGCMIRWLDFNDTWRAADWGHPSDNLGGILAIADYLSRRNSTSVDARLTMREVLTAMVKAYEIQGVIALENGFNRVGLDHVLLVRVATAGVAASLLGGPCETVINAVSNAWVDGGTLRVYRHAPNTGSRKSWAAGDATSRGVWLALMCQRGEMGYPTALSAPTWGYSNALLRGRPLSVTQKYGSYVMENILFKVSVPAEFHAQTACEAAIRLHPEVKDRLDSIDRIIIETQDSAIRIIDKTGPLHNPADRDHCIQYIVAVALVKGNLSAEDYEATTAREPRIDALRTRMKVLENKAYTRAYLDPERRAIANAVQVFFEDGSGTDRVEVMYPLGHRRRRAEALPMLEAKFKHNVSTRLMPEQCRTLVDIFGDQERLEEMPVQEFMDQWVVQRKW